MRSLLILLCCAVLLFPGCAPAPPEKADPLDLVPGSSVAVLRISDTEQFRADFRNVPLFQSLIRHLEEKPWVNSIDEVLALDPPSGALVAFGPEGQWILVLPGSGASAPYLPPGSLPRDSSVSSEPAWQLPDSTAAFFEQYRQIRLVGSTKHYLQQALGEAGNPPAGLDKALRAANPLAEASLFLPPASPVASAATAQGGRSTDEGKTWSAYDFLSGAGSLSFQGMEAAGDSTAHARDLLRTQPALPLQKAAAIIPGEATAWLSYSLARPEQFRKLQESFLGKGNPHPELLESVEQLSLVETPGSLLLVIHSLNAEVVEEELSPLREEPLEFQGTMVYPLKGDQTLQATFAPLLDQWPAPAYYCAFEDAFVFSQTLESLQEVISAKNRSATFDRSREFESLKPSLSTASNTLLLAKDPARSKLLGDSLLVGSPPPGILENLPAGHALAAQLNLESRFTLSSYQFAEAGQLPGDRPRVAEVFTVSLDAPAYSRPQFLKNHRSGGMDIAVQDENHVLYLFSGSGELFWKKQLAGPLQGQIHQVDLLRNGRLQMAFTTDTQLVVLDRDGKEVAPFPREFPGGNLGPLAVFDYEQNRNYRLLVTQGSNVHMFDAQGRDVKGFKFRDAGSPVIAAPVHIRIGNRDYLVFQLDSGELRILNRVGDIRVRVQETFEFSSNPVRLYRDGFAFTDRKGNLVHVDTRGRVNRTKLNLSPDHGMDATTRTLTLMDDNRFQVKSNKRELELGVYTRPQIFYLNDIIYVAVTDLQSQLAYLFRSTAEPVSGFPVEGSGLVDMADMDNDRSMELVVPYRKNSLRVYRLSR